MVISGKEVNLIGGGRAQIAEYKPQMIPEYTGNPFIEALPPIWSRIEAIDALSFYPEFHSKECDLDAHYRYHFIQRLFRYFQPLTQHIDLEQKISRLIRQGYIGRNPKTTAYLTDLKQVRSQVTEANQTPKENEVNEDCRQLANSFTILGISGIGKTTSIDRVLSLYPQVIVHETPLNLYQLVWMKLECPFDGSVKGLCVSFFEKVDQFFGTQYKRKFASSSHQSVDMMMPNMAHVAFLHGLGLLVIDEIQCLSVAKSGGAEKMLNFFVTLVNRIGVPVVLIGTPKAVSILQEAFRQARRGTGQGSMVWNCMERDANWELLIEGLWEYQWTREKAVLDEVMHSVLYEESQGIIDVAVKLYMLAQINAISRGIEIISPEIIKTVAKENLKLIQPMIAALKSGDLSEVAKFDDIKPIDIDDALKKYMPVDTLELIRLQRQKEADKRNNQHVDLLEKITLELLRLDINSSVAQQVAEKITVKYGNDADVGLLIKEAMKLALQMEDSIDSTANTQKTKKKSAKKETVVIFDSNDLRSVPVESKGENKSAYEILKSKGYIKNPKEEFGI